MTTDIRQKLEDVKKVLADDIQGADMKLSIFVASAINFRWDSCCTPFPPKFRSSSHDSKDIERLRRAIECIPPLKNLISEEPVQPENDAIELLHWLLVETTGPTLKSIPKKDFNRILSLTPQETSFNLPSHIFAVEYKSTSTSEVRFQNYAKDFDTSFAFHGTKVFYLHNIAHQGLQQHLNKTALFGEGLYLSRELTVSLPFSRNGLGWSQSSVADNMACVTLCEFVEHPVFAKHKESTKGSKELPEKYILVSNNDIVRLRYLIVYANTKPKHDEKQRDWKTTIFNFKFFAFIYLILLIFIGMNDTRYVNYLKVNVLRKIQYGWRILLGK